MSFKWVFKLGRHLPELARALGRPMVKRYFELRGFPLAGALAGCRMRGELIASYCEGIYEPEICQTIMRIVEPGWVCVDAGAYVGYYSLLLAKLVGERGRIIAFEAHPKNAEQLRSNVRINGYETQV